MPLKQETPSTTLWLTKRLGQREVFDRRKLLESIVRAGGSLRLAHEVLAALVFRQDMTTDELRRRVASGLQGKDPALARRYKHTFTLWAHSHPWLTRDVARLHSQTIARFGIHEGHFLQVHHGHRYHSVPVERDDKVPLRQILLFSQTLELLHAPVGVLVAVKC